MCMCKLCQCLSCSARMSSTWLGNQRVESWLSQASRSNAAVGSSTHGLTSEQLLHLKWNENLKTWEIIAMLTSGFLNSLGLTQRMKKGLHSPRVFISRSVDFLNCDDKVTWEENNFEMLTSVVKCVMLTTVRNVGNPSPSSSCLSLADWLAWGPRQRGRQRTGGLLAGHSLSDTKLFPLNLKHLVLWIGHEGE